MTETPTTPTQTASPTLDDLMLAMDVVDTLRHDQRLVERELSLGYSDEALIERLRQIYRGQGIEVPDHVLEEGVKALREKRFSYEPSKPSFARKLALAWIDRRRIGKIAAGIVAVVLAAVLIHYFAITRPRELAETRAREEIGQVLPNALQAGYEAISTEAKSDSAKSQAERLLADGKAALKRGDAQGARKTSADMTALLNELRAEFDLRIVNGPGEASGVWRKPKVNPTARNDYLIVEAVASDGRVLSRTIRNEETGATSTVKKWGIRVNNEAFQRVLADKRDDGIIEKNLVGQKKRGSLDIDYVMPVLGGAITEW
ncbi:DUF6384 family protein [Methylocystis sp.]|uniref:DUF6384 family protein n=1 Tax=Methylocystis sp. TaxID=1911079 RepID=UPI0025F9FAF3|nr:DUF6384 family protein [Methylocystis sp.]